MMVLKVVPTILVVFTACTGEPDAYDRFTQSLEAGASCADLFAIRNDINPKDPSITRIHEDLRAVGCFTSTSVRSARPTATATGVSRQDSLTPTAPSGGSESPTSSYTVREYRVYRSIIDTPMSVNEAEAVRAAAKTNGMTVAEAQAAVQKVQSILSRNNWFGTPDSEIKRASDWSPSR